METYPDVTPLWDLSHSSSYSQLPDDDFLALLQKQFPPSTDNNNFMAGFGDSVNPQNISRYSLPSLTPPSEDSSPSPPNMNQDGNQDDMADPALKRKASEDSFDEGPSQKTQHTLGNDRKGNGISAGRRKSGGGTGPPKDENRLMKRKEQNRAAQRAFRERKEKHVKDLEDKVAALEAKNEQAQHENENLRDLLSRLQSENVMLKQSSFTFSVPKSSGNAIEQNRVSRPYLTEPLFSPLTPSQAQSVSSPGSSRESPKLTNPLDLSSLTSFDPNMLSLLDDSPQPTATQSAMHMNFESFQGSNTGLAENSPYTTIASNPMFFSQASLFDSAAPLDFGNLSNNNGLGSINSNINHNGSFNFSDLHSLSPWPTPSNSQDNATLDDLFAGYLSQAGSVDYPFHSPSSISPVSHHSHLNNNANNNLNNPRSPAVSSSSSPSSVMSDPMFGTPGNSATSDSDVDHSECPNSKSKKAECVKLIVMDGPSPFVVSPPANSNSPNATGNPLRKSTDFLGSMITCAGSNFPKTQKSDKNIEVLSAWRSITSNPNFKDLDINELCHEFTDKARCDGTKVVLEPQGVHSILESLAKKQ